MTSLRSMLQPTLSVRFAFSYTVTLTFLIIIHLLHISNLLFIVQIFIVGAVIYLSRNRISEKILLGILSGLATLLIAFFLRRYRHIFSDIVEWDFLCFYFNGKATVEGLSLYNPSSFANVLSNAHLPFTLSNSFYKEAIQTGVIYPPTTMLMVAPIGYLNPNMANIVWRIFVLSFLIFDIIFLCKIFLINKSRLFQLLIITILVLMFPGLNETVIFGQTNFILLFLILLIYKDPDNWKAGIFLALSIIVKPIPVVWCLYFLVNRKWKPMFSFIITGIVIVILSIIVVGFNNFITFFISPPTLRIPQSSFIENINQSMNAVFSRICLYFGWNSVINYIKWIVLIFSIFLTVITCIASTRLAKTKQSISFLIFVPLSLLIFPGTLTHYAVQLIPLFVIMIAMADVTSLFLFMSIFLLLYFNLFIASFVILSIIIMYTLFNIPVFTKLGSKRFIINDGMWRKYT